MRQPTADAHDTRLEAPGHDLDAPGHDRVREVLAGPMAWRGDTIAQSDWRAEIPAPCIAELSRTLELLRSEAMPTETLDPAEYPLDACARLMDEARRRLDEGPGVVVLDRLPVERYTEAQCRQVFWLLGALLGRPVSQSIQGEFMVDVRDTGVKKAIGIRGFRTNSPQLAHTDNSFNLCPPEHVSLLSLRKSSAGGESRFISFHTVHNELLARHPLLLPRLHRPFYQDRQGDFPPGESQTVFFPVFSREGGVLCTRFGHFTIPAGYETAGIAFEGEDRAAFEAMCEVIEDPDLYCSLVIEPGQLQIVNNRTVGHGRTAYTDPPEASGRRHLLRLWHRNRGRRTYSG